MHDTAFKERTPGKQGEMREVRDHYARFGGCFAGACLRRTGEDDEDKTSGHRGVMLL